MILSFGWLLKTAQNAKGFSVVLFFYFSLIPSDTQAQFSQNLTYRGCFSKLSLDRIVRNASSELAFVSDPTIDDDQFEKNCGGYFKTFADGENLIVTQHQILLCINLPPQLEVRFIQVNESLCSLRTANSTKGRNYNIGGTNAIALYSNVNYNIKLQYEYEFELVEFKYRLSAPVNYTTRYFDWVKHYHETLLCKKEYRTPKQEASALLSFLFSYVPYADLRPSLCVEYCNYQYNHVYDIDEGIISNYRAIKYAVLSRTDTKNAFFGLCHCTNNIKNFSPTTITFCPACISVDVSQNTTSCINHDFTIHEVYCTDGNDRGSCTCKDSENKQCKANDPYGSTWTACPGVTIQRPCPNTQSINRNASWTCNSNGEFQDMQPDYKDCSSAEFEKIDNLSRRTKANATEIWTKLKNLVITPRNNPDDILQGTGTQPSQVKYLGHQIKRINEIVTSQFEAGLENATTQNEREIIITDAVKVSANLISIRDPWRQLNSRTRSATATDCISTVENNLFTFAQVNMERNSTSSSMDLDLFPIDEDHDGFRVTLANANEAMQQKIKFPSDSESTFITIRLNSSFPQENAQYVGIQMESTYMDSLTPPNVNSLGKNHSAKNSTVFNGNIISLTFSNETMGKLASENGVEIKISHDMCVITTPQCRKEHHRKLHPGVKAKAVLGETVCAYWDTKLLLWSSDDCKKIPNRSNSQETVCECNHLTAFAVLTDTLGYIGNDKGLEILTLILCPLSIFCLIATIVILTKMRVLHGERSTITKHLCVNLIIGNLFLLLLVDRTYFCISSDIICTIVGIITHYVFLSAFGWMAVQGLYLHRMVVQIFDKGKSYMLVYTIGAYSYPLIPIGLTTIIGYGVNKDDSCVPYGGAKFCWLNGDYIWAFLGPIAIILIGNFIMMVRTMQTVHNISMKNKMNNTKAAKIKSNRKWVKGCLSLTVLLGLTWTSGFFTFLDNETFFFMSYVFTVLNASQGIFILIFYCLLHKDVQPLFLKKLDWLKSSFPKKTSATAFKSSAISKPTSSTRVTDPRSQENENYLNTGLDETKFARSSETMPSLNQPNAHKYSDSSDYEDDEKNEMGLQEVIPPPYSSYDSEDERENNEAAEIQAINSPSPISHNKVLECYDEGTRRESTSSESEENESDDGDEPSLGRRKRIIGPPYIDEMVESEMYTKRSEN